MSATAVTTNRALLEAYADAKGAHDVDVAMSFCHDDFAYETAGVAGSRVEGRDAARAFYTQLFEVLPDYFGDFDGMVVDGDTGVAWGRFGGTSSITGMSISTSLRTVSRLTFFIWAKAMTAMSLTTSPPRPAGRHRRRARRSAGST